MLNFLRTYNAPLKSHYPNSYLSKNLTDITILKRKWEFYSPSVVSLGPACYEK